MHGMFSLRAGLSVACGLVAMLSALEASAQDAGKNKDWPRGRSAIHIALKGSEAQLKQECSFLEPRLKQLNILFHSGCRTSGKGRYVFIFEKKDYVGSDRIPGLFLEAFNDQLKRSYPTGKRTASTAAARASAASAPASAQAREAGLSPETLGVNISEIECRPPDDCGDGRIRAFPCGCYELTP